MTDKGKTTIVAEIGQNHNGDMTIARQLIDMAAMPVFDKFGNRELPRVNAVKFTKRDLSEELTVEANKRPYDSPHAFGKTYGEHRRALELDYEQYVELESHARTRGLDFVVTLTSIKTIRLLKLIRINAIKVASRDMTNLPLLEALAETGEKMILSTGMSREKEIDQALEVITKKHEKIAILHCVSQYPAAYENMNLLSIPYLKDKYGYDTGLSDHSIGIVMAPVAVALGAVLIEKHITLNRSMKGSDQSGSLEPDGLWRMVRDIRNVEIALGTLKKDVPPGVEQFREKLERSIASSRDIAKGEVLQESDLCLLSPGTGLKWIERDRITGKRARHDIPKHTLIGQEDVND
jgi:sialic acid synthase